MATTNDCGHGAARTAAPAAGAPVLQFQPKGWPNYRHAADGTVPASGCLLSVVTAARVDEIEVSVLREGMHCGFRVSAADARALAAELLAAAGAVEG